MAKSKKFYPKKLKSLSLGLYKRINDYRNKTKVFYNSEIKYKRFMNNRINTGKRWAYLKNVKL